MRELKGVEKKIVYLIVLAMGIFHLYTAVFGSFEAYLQRIIHITFALPVVFLLVPPKKGLKQTKIPWYDWILAILSILPGIYAIYNYDEIASRFVQVDPVTTAQLILAIILTVLLLEATRRVVGWPLTLIACIFLAYMEVGQYLPGMLKGVSFKVSEIAELLYLTDEGIMGIPLGVSATFVMIFLILGGFLEKSGVGDFFMDLAQAFTGKTRGGPAKIAVVSSGLFGMLSGSAVANVYSTGTLTIPLMKKIGYESHFAAAVEAVASSGGQIMPPIMGASAFIIASFLGVPYKDVMIAAFTPAVLYYFAVGLMVHFRAIKLGLRGLREEELPSKKKILKKWYMVSPVVILIYMLFAGYTPMRAAVFAILITWICSLFDTKTRMGVKDILDAIYKGSLNILVVALACGTAGIIIGSITLTGFGFKFVSAVFAFAKGIPFAGLVLIMLVAIVLGMGLPTTGAYLLAAALGVPALIKLGFSPMASHLFVFYFAIVSAITPPVALAAYAAASIAGSEPNKTGFTAMRLGIIAYVIPYAFVYDKGILLNAGLFENAVAVTAAFIGATGLASAMEGYLFRHLNILERAILIALSIVCFLPLWELKIAGFIGILAFSLLYLKRRA